jgi:hypothetical protein
MRLAPSGIARATVTALAGVGLVVAAMHAQGAVAVGDRAGAPGLTTRGATTTVRGASLTCPGPELRGVPGMPDLPVAARVAAAAAPLRALTGTTPVSRPGQVAVTGMPGQGAPAVATQRATAATDDLGTPVSGLVTGTEALAPGLAAVQSWLVPSGDQRALASVPCGRAQAESWILAGGEAPGRQERLVLTNPGGNAVSVDVTLHGADGPVASPIGKGLVVPAHGRTSFLLDSISGTLASPVVHVVAQGGVVGAVVNDLWLDGTRAAGSDDAVPAAAPSRDQVIPGVLVSGAATLRVAVPGDTEAVVQARVLTPDGPRALPRDGVVRVQGGMVRDIDLTGLDPRATAIQVRADVPVVAAVMTTGRAKAGAPSDFAWTSSTPPVTGVAGMPLVQPLQPGQPQGAPPTVGRLLTLTASASTAGVEVVTVDPQGVERSQRLTLQPDTTIGLSVTGQASVWVHRLLGHGQVRAGVVSWVNDQQGTLLSVTPLLDTALRTTTLGLRESRDD